MGSVSHHLAIRSALLRELEENVGANTSGADREAALAACRRYDDPGNVVSDITSLISVHPQYLDFIIRSLPSPDVKNMR